jgi:release factor glutamine methyltransferase
VSAIVATSFQPTLYRRAWRHLLRAKLALLDRRRYERVVLEEVEGIQLVVLPDVFNPKLLRSGEFLVQQLRREDLLPVGARVLDLGCGSGAVGVAAARRGSTVVASDINPSAVRCTRINAQLNGVELEVRQGDLFEPVAGEQFDVVVFNPPYYRGVPRDDLDHAWRSPDVADRFGAQLGQHLTDGGHALVVLSSDGDGGGFLKALDRNGYATEPVASRDFINEVMTVYLVRTC